MYSVYMHYSIIIEYNNSNNTNHNISGEAARSLEKLRGELAARQTRLIVAHNDMNTMTTNNNDEEEEDDT